MTRYKLEIEQDSTGTWVGTSNLELEGGKTTYIVIGNTLEELREMVQEGVNNDLEIEEISFEEVFLTKSKATSQVRISSSVRARPAPPMTCITPGDP